MSFSINDIGKIFGVGKPSEVGSVVADGKIDCIFTQGKSDYVSGTPFTHGDVERLHAMNIVPLIED